MEPIVAEILRKKVVEKVSTLELLNHYPGYKREIALIALSELPMERLKAIIPEEVGVLRQVKEYKRLGNNVAKMVKL